MQQHRNTATMKAAAHTPAKPPTDSKPAEKQKEVMRLEIGLGLGLGLG